MTRDRRASTDRGDIEDPDTAGFDDVIEDDDEEPDTGTSVDDLTSEADPATFDQTFTDDGADLNIQGRYDPTAGPKQVLPRVAYVLNYNLVYNEARDRWEPQKKRSDEGRGFGDTFRPRIIQGMAQPAVRFDLDSDTTIQQTQPAVTVTDV